LKTADERNHGELENEQGWQLAKFRVLMIMGKYDAMIGYTNLITCRFKLVTNKGASLPANYSAVSTYDHQNTEFRQKSATT